MGEPRNEIFGSPDDQKLRSCATLFASVSPPGSVYEQVLAKYFGGEPDDSTLELLRAGAQGCLGARRARPGTQNDDFGSLRNSTSSGVDSRPSTALRCGNRPKRSMMTLCACAYSVQ